MAYELNGLHIIRDPREAAHALSKDRLIGFDTETTGLSPWRDKIALMQFYGDESGSLAVVQISNGKVPDELKELFSPERTFICHNAVAFDLLMLNTHDVPWQRPAWYDTLVGETVCVSTGRKDVRKSLAASAHRRLGTTIDKAIEHGHWHEELSDRQLEYAAQDVISLPALYRAQLEKAAETNQLDALQLEQAIMPYVAKMTMNGLPCTTEKMYEFIRQQEVLLHQLHGRMVATFGDINFNSHVQIKRAVREIYGQVWESTAEAALRDIMYDNPKFAPLAKLILDYRAPAQRLKMYNDEFIHEHIIDNRIHSRFWQCSADTGRFTCSDPNLQQVPRDARWFIGNVPGLDIVAVDYSQIEVRVAAYIAQDQALLQALDAEDIHKSIASMIFKKPESEIAKEERRKAKAAVFALLYCGGVSRLYNQAREDGSPMTMEEANDVYTAFFQRFQGLWGMRNKAIRMAKNNRMNTVRMPSGLRRVLVGKDNRPSVILNNTVQGFAAAGLKQGILLAGQHGLFEYAGAQVHDEIVAAVPSNIAEEYGECLKKDMIAGMQKYLPVTVKAEVKRGPYWK